jgi:hypothetical protein
MFENVQYAEVIAVDETGASLRTIQSLRVVDGHVMVDEYITGKKNGLLVVHYKDGNVNTIYLGTGNTTTPVSQTASAGGFAINGHYILQDPDVISITALYERPTVFVTTTVAKVVTIDVVGVYNDQLGPVVELPRSVFIQDAEKSSFEQEIELEKNVINLPANAKLRLRFGWSTFGNPGVFYTGEAEKGI